MLTAAAALYLPPQSLLLPLGKHQRSIACSLWLIYRQCQPTRRAVSLTSQSSGGAFEVCSNQHCSCCGGGCCCCRWCWCWMGGWLCKCKCDQYEAGLLFHSKQHSVHMHQSKNSFEQELFPLLLTCHCVQIVKNDVVVFLRNKWNINLLIYF